MFAFFDALLEIIRVIFQYVEIVGYLIYQLFVSIPRAVGYIVSIVAYAPEFLTSFVMMFVAISIVLNILNKGA